MRRDVPWLGNVQASLTLLSPSLRLILVFPGACSLALRLAVKTEKICFLLYVLFIQYVKGLFVLFAQGG